MPSPAPTVPPFQDFQGFMAWQQPLDRDLDEQVHAMTKEETAIDARLSAIDQALLRLRKEADDKKNTLAKPKTYKQVHTVVISVATSNAAPDSAMDVTYMVPGASWTPSYDIRIASDDNTMTLTYYALVRQNTVRTSDVGFVLHSRLPLIVCFVGRRAGGRLGERCTQLVDSGSGPRWGAAHHPTQNSQPLATAFFGPGLLR